MTLQASGAIALSQVDTEIGRASTANIALGEQAVRDLAGIQSGAISMSNLYGKQYMTAAIASAYIQNNRYKCFQHCFGQPGSDYGGTNNPYSRYTSSSSYSRTGLSFPARYTRNTTVVGVFAAGAGTPQTITSQLNGSNVSMVNRYNGPGETQINSGQIALSIDTVTSTYQYWTHASGNHGSWAANIILPGTWNYSSTQIQNVNTSPDVVTLAPYSIAIGSGYGNYNGGWNQVASVPAGCSYVCWDSWWYNNGSIFLLINPTASNQNFTITHCTVDSYGNRTHVMHTQINKFVYGGY